MSDETKPTESGPEPPEEDMRPAASPKAAAEAVQKVSAASPLEAYHTRLRVPHVLSIAALVVLLDYLFYQGTGGLSFGIAFAVLPVVSAVFAFRKPPVVPLVFYGFFFTLVVLRCAWQQGALVVLAGMILLVTLPIALRLGRLNMADLMTSLPITCVMGIATWPYDLNDNWQRSRRSGSKRRGKLPLNTMGIPLLVCAAFAVVFVLSNPILQDYFTRWYGLLENGLGDLLQRYAPTPLRGLFWCVSFLFAGILLRPAIEKARADSGWQEDAVLPGGDTGDLNLHYRIALNTLIGVNVLFVLYNGVDAYHLLIRDALPVGLNHSQYTHQGAFWLTVALLMATVVVGRIFHGGLNFHPGRNTLLNWAGLWLAQNFILATWVFLRIHMYVGYNGMTRMRIVAFAGTALVVVGLALVTVKALRRLSLTWLVRKEMGAFVVTCLLLAVLPMDYLCWQFNVSNILASDPPRTSVQLTRQPLTPEGLGTLTALLAHPDPVIAEGVAGLLGRWYFSKGLVYADDGRELDRWTHYQLGHARCARALAKHKDQIIRLVPDGDWKDAIKALREHTSRWI